MDILYKILIDPFVQMGTSPDLLVQTLWDGLVAGVLYALIALGFVLIFKASGVFNFAQGIMVVFAALTLVGLHERGVPAFVALALTIVVMFVLAYGVERLMLRPLVNQSDIILFMATFGLTYFLIGVGQLVFGGNPKVMIASDLYLPSGAFEFKALGGFVSLQKIDIAAVVIASVMVGVLAVFFQRTRIGRALRAVADSHQAALSVGISLEQIWVIVWFAAGVVALATGIMWGARSEVSFSLQIIALKALPVLILGGLTSIPGAIVGGLIIGIGEKLGEILLGAAPGRRHRDLVRLRDRARLSGIPAPGSVRRENHRADLTMLYREAGQYKTSYAADMAVFPILQDRIGLAVILLIAFVVIPLSGNNFLLNSVLIPFLIFALATIGLNLLTGYTGLLSLGTGGFMGVGAYACLKLTTFFPQVNIIVWILASGFFSAAVGVLFGLPSLRIKGFYLAVATLAAQFFLEWCFIRIPWLYNNSVSGAIEVPLRTLFGVPITGPTATPVTRYLIVLAIVVAMTWVASNLVHGRIGRMWMSVRDMDLAAELIGIRLLPAKLLAFAVSSFYCGVAGAMMVFLWYGGAEAEVFAIDQSFLVLFMVIIGGLGTLIGSFFGAALIYILPIALRAVPAAFGLPIHPAAAEQLTFVIVGALIVVFLVLEPAGLARLWQIGKQKLRVWPFPY